MTSIECFRVSIQTRRVSAGGTDGDVYIGFCGRELSLDTDADDDESGSTTEVVNAKTGIRLGVHSGLLTHLPKHRGRRPAAQWERGKNGAGPDVDQLRCS